MIKKFKKNRFLLWSFALYPIFGQYILKSVPISLGQILMILGILWMALLGERPTLNKSIFFTGLALAAYNFVPGLLLYNSITNTINNSLSILFTFLLFSCAFNELSGEIEEYYLIIKKIGIICTLFIFIQAILHFRYGINIYGRLTFLDGLFKCDNNLVFLWIDYGHPCSFFYEPAHYSIYMAPPLLLSLSHKDYLVTVLCAIGMFVSTSSTGYAMVVLSITLFVFFSVETKYKFGLIPIMLVAFIYLISYSGLDLSKFQLDNINSNIRVFGTLEYFKSFTLSDWLFGVGFNRLAEWGSIRGVNNKGYANSFFFMVFSYGLFGLFMCIYFIRVLINRDTWKPLAIIVIALLFSDQMCFNRNFIYLVFILLLCAGYNKDNLEKTTKKLTRQVDYTN